MPLEATTIAEELRALGYDTALFGKWHLAASVLPPLSEELGPARQGFVETLVTMQPKANHDPEDDPHHVDQLTRRAVQFLETSRTAPFFLEVAYNSIHAPVMESRAWVNKYQQKAESGRPENSAVIGAMMERMDGAVGQILDKLDELGLRESTLVIFWSDNGGSQRDASQTPLRGGKAQLYEGGIRVPFIIRWPDVVEAGRLSATPVIAEDFYPTLISVAGGHPNGGILDGVNLAPLLQHGDILPPRALYWHYPHYHVLGTGPSGAIRLGEWKLVENFFPAGAELPEIELFNLASDPGEVTNLAAKEPARVESMLKMLVAWRQEVGAQMPTANPEYDSSRQRERRRGKTEESN